MGKTITTVCHRTTGSRTGLSIGKAGSIDPATGLPFDDSEYFLWQTKSPCCQTCGEMIGTSRRKFGSNRWPATVEACVCERCGVQICERCRNGYQTSEVIGSHKRRTEGGYTYRVPTKRTAWLCVPCGKEYMKENPPKPPVDIFDTFLKIVRGG